MTAKNARVGHRNKVRLNRAICAAADKGAMKELVHLVAKHQQRMNLVNLSTAIHRIARLSVDGHRLEESAICDLLVDRILSELMLRRSESLLHGDEAGAIPRSELLEPQTQCLSSVSWACARLQISNAPLHKTIGDLAVVWLKVFKACELSNLLWAFAKLGVNHPPLASVATQHVHDHVHELSPRILSKTAWAFATSKMRPIKLTLAKIADAFAAKSCEGEDVNAACIANMVWALATARAHTKTETMIAIGSTALRKLHDFKSFELAVTLWSFARGGFFHDMLFDQAAWLLHGNHALRNEIHAQGISNILWAFARRSAWQGCMALSEDVLTTLLERCEWLVPRFSPLEMVSVLQSVAELAGHWGYNPVADRVWAAAAACRAAHELFCSQEPRTAHLDQLASSCSRFLGTCDSAVPKACRAFAARAGVQFDALPFSAAPDAAPDAAPLEAVSQHRADDLTAHDSSSHDSSPVIRKDAFIDDHTNGSSMSLEPAYIHVGAGPIPVAPGFELNPAYIPAPSPIVFNDEAARPEPLLTVLEECMAMEEDAEFEKHVDIVFEIAAVDGLTGVSAEICAHGGKDEIHMFFDATSDDNLYHLCCPSSPSSWTARLSALCTGPATSASSAVVGDPVILSFVGGRLISVGTQARTIPDRLARKNFHSVDSIASTVASTIRDLIED
jgi:hypothetical protein